MLSIFSKNNNKFCQELNRDLIYKTVEKYINKNNEGYKIDSQEQHILDLVEKYNNNNINKNKLFVAKINITNNNNNLIHPFVVLIMTTISWLYRYNHHFFRKMFSNK